MLGSRVDIFLDIDVERDRQDAKHGYQKEHGRHLNEWWLPILTEEVGEASEEMLNVHFHGESEINLRKELLHVAATAVAWIEAIDKRSSNENTNSG